MTKPVLCCLGIGQKYLAYAAACLTSAHEHVGAELDCVLFHAHADIAPFRSLDFVEFVDLGRTFESRGGDAKGLKAVPLCHSHLRDRLVLFLDADCLVYSSRILDLFPLIEQHSIYVFGQHFAPEQVDHSFPYANEQGFHLPSVATSAGHKVRNLGLHSGLLGRKPDALGLRFADEFDRLLQTDIVPFRDEHFADEPFAALAYAIVTQQDEAEEPPRGFLCPVPYNLFVCTGAVREECKVFNAESGHPDLLWNDCYWFIKPAIVHYVRADFHSFYIRRVVELLGEHQADVSWLLDGFLGDAATIGTYCRKKVYERYVEGDRLTESDLRSSSVLRYDLERLLANAAEILSSDYDESLAAELMSLLQEYPFLEVEIPSAGRARSVIRGGQA